MLKTPYLFSAHFQPTFSKVLLFVLIAIVIVAENRIDADICDLCVCLKNECINSKTVNNLENSACTQDFSEYKYKCDGNDDVLKKLNQTIDLDNIQWPSVNATVSAQFTNLKLTYLTKVLCSASTPLSSPTLVAINLDDNFIESISGDPFQYCHNLTSISIANNLVQVLSLDFLKSATSLQLLNLSSNALSEFDGKILSQSKQLIELDLSHNQITTLKVNEILDASPNIETINAANNLLFVISSDSRVKYRQLKKLNLAGNKLTVITTTTFSTLPNLQYLSVSSNHLSNIERDAFITLSTLHTLNLSTNDLHDLALNLPDSIEELTMSSNFLKYWPMANIPKNLKFLELQQNQLIEMYNSAALSRHTIELSHIMKINVSHNHIDLLPSTLYYPSLNTLDISFNDFTEIPNDLGHQAPNLDWLRMRGNPMKQIKFSKQIVTRKIDLSEMPLLKELDGSQFNSIASKSGCVELTISHCPALRKIQNSFLKVMDLCYLDLSYNGFNAIDHNWANWSSLSRGVDFQGNPITCTCSLSQWVVDILVPLLYNRTEHQHFLHNLRCASPDRFKGHRLVRYSRQEDAFCNEKKVNQAYFDLYSGNQPADNSGLSLDKGLGLFIVIVSIAIIIASSTAIIVILYRRQRLRLLMRNNRRFNNGCLL